jgi:hypothetical protein
MNVLVEVRSSCLDIYLEQNIITPDNRIRKAQCVLSEF